jgi:NAD(P)-dependent dehydrogenase (short-subunit alcohol dehydrogenase family)
MTGKNYWEGRFCIVTGAASGIGLATSKMLIAQGATVLGLDKSDESDSIKQVFSKNQSSYLKCDLAKPQEIENAFGSYSSSKLSALFNIAALPTNGLGIQDTSVQDWDLIINVNLRSIFLTSKYSLPLFKNNNGGCIVNVSSVHAYATMKNHAAYAASKGGVNSLTTQLAIELNPLGIRVVGVAPGSIRTPMTTMNLEKDSEVLNKLGFPTDGKSIGHVGEPEEIAQTLLWCASSEASFITGTTIQADGGLLARLGYENGN